MLILAGLAAWLLLCLSPHLRILAEATPDLSAPKNVTADKPINITTDQKLDPEDYKRFDAYRVYVSLEPPGWGAGPVCWLAWAESFDVKSIEAVVPANIAPDNTRFRISSGHLTNGKKHPNGYYYSSRVTLRGGNGTWSQRELDGRTISDENRVSCNAFGCVRECMSRWYTDNGADESKEKEEEDCVTQCVKTLNPTRSDASIRTSSAMAALTLGVAWVLFTLV